LGQLLGIPSRWPVTHCVSRHRLFQPGFSRWPGYDLDGFLKKHQVWLEYSIDDFERERALSEKLWQRRQTQLAEEAASSKQ
jgi:hypothetical protein